MRSLALLLVLFSGLTEIKAQSVSEVIIYKDFLKAGSTTRLLNAFHHPVNFPKSGVDTSNINKDQGITAVEFTRLLATAKRKNHHQMKIGGVRFAGEMIIDGQKHFYLYCGPTLLIDLTDRVNYWLDDNQSTSLKSRSR